MGTSRLDSETSLTFIHYYYYAGVIRAIRQPDCSGALIINKKKLAFNLGKKSRKKKVACSSCLFG